MKWANNFHINVGHRHPGKEENMDNAHELWFLAGEAWSLKIEDFGHVGSNTMDKEYRILRK